MRKKRLFSISIILTTVFLCSIFFTGCSGSAQSNNSDKQSDIVPFSVDESKETMASQPNLIDKLANAALIGNTGSIESDVNDEYVDGNDEYYVDSSEEFNDSDYEYSEDVEEQKEYDESVVEEPVYEETVYEEPDYDEVVEDTSDYEDEYVEEYYEEDDYYEEEYYDDYSYEEYVWLSATGSKYHNRPDCGNMNPDNAYQVTISYAEEHGYDPCKKCF